MYWPSKQLASKPDGRVERAHDALHRVDVLVDQRVGADELADLLDAAAVRDQFLARGHVDAVHVGKSHRRRRAEAMYTLRAPASRAICTISLLVCRARWSRPPAARCGRLNSTPMALSFWRTLSCAPPGPA
jgi:hypothetical protein